MNIQKMLQQAQQMQAKLAKTQAELAEKTVESSVGGGKITVTANGAGDVLSIKIDPSVVDPQDVEILEDLVLAGVTQAIQDARKAAGLDVADRISLRIGGDPAVLAAARAHEVLIAGETLATTYEVSDAAQESADVTAALADGTHARLRLHRAP